MYGCYGIGHKTQRAKMLARMINFTALEPTQVVLENASNNLWKIWVYLFYSILFHALNYLLEKLFVWKRSKRILRESYEHNEICFL